jgi:hypothetical protein
MNDQNTPPVTVAEIASLLSQLRTLSPPQHGDTAARTAFLATKANLLARIAAQHARDWTCDHVAHARHVSADALVVAEQAQTVIEPVRPDPMANSGGPQ